MILPQANQVRGCQAPCNRINQMEHPSSHAIWNKREEWRGKPRVFVPTHLQPQLQGEVQTGGDTPAAHAHTPGPCFSPPLCPAAHAQPQFLLLFQAIEPFLLSPPPLCPPTRHPGLEPASANTQGLAKREPSIQLLLLATQRTSRSWDITACS